jgi:hypothetical protein
MWYMSNANGQGASAATRETGDAREALYSCNPVCRKQVRAVIPTKTQCRLCNCNTLRNSELSRPICSSEVRPYKVAPLSGPHYLLCSHQ